MDTTARWLWAPWSEMAREHGHTVMTGTATPSVWRNLPPTNSPDTWQA